MRWLVRLLTGYSFADVAIAIGMYNRMYRRRIVVVYLLYVAAVVLAIFGIEMAWWIWDTLLISPNGKFFYEMLPSPQIAPIFLAGGVVIDEMEREICTLGSLVVLAIWLPLLYLPARIPFPPPQPLGLLSLPKKVHFALMTILPSVIMLVCFVLSSEFKYLLAGPRGYTHGITEWLGTLSYCSYCITAVAIPAIIVLFSMSATAAITKRTVALLGSISLFNLLNWLFGDWIHISFTSIDERSYIHSLWIGLLLVLLALAGLAAFKPYRAEILIVIIAVFTGVKLAALPLLLIFGPYVLQAIGCLSILWGDNFSGSLINIGSMM